MDILLCFFSNKILLIGYQWNSMYLTLSFLFAFLSRWERSKVDSKSYSLSSNLIFHTMANFFLYAKVSPWFIRLQSQDGVLLKRKQRLFFEGMIFTLL